MASRKQAGTTAFTATPNGGVVSRHRRRERLSFVDDPGRHTRAAVIARRRDEAVYRAARIEETVAGFEHPIGLAPGLEYQGTFEDIASLVARVRVIADRRARRQHRRPDHDFLAGHARLVVAFEYGSYRLRGRLRLVRRGIHGPRNHGEQRNMHPFHTGPLRWLTGLPW